MSEYLLCKAADSRGMIDFIIYSDVDKTVHEYDISAVTQKIIKRDIVNAKLENSVVKITDSKRALAKLSFEEKTHSAVFYILEEYISARGTKMFCAVSNTGEIFEFSENIVPEFCEKRKIVNGYVNKSGLHIINVPAFVTPLHKSLKLTRTK